MFDFLPAESADPIPGAPLNQVIAQVKFNAQSSLSTQQGVGVLYDALSDRYPRLLTDQQAVITASPGGVTTTQVPMWRLTTIEGQTTLVVGPEQLAIETNSYTTWSDTRRALDEALRALGDIAKPRVRERIGLRYINHISSDQSGSFASSVRAELRGLVDTDGWRQATTASLSQMLLRDGNTQLTVRYGSGPLVIEEGLFVLDIDCADDQPVPFETEDTLRYFDMLNDASYRCFCACVTKELRAGC